MTDDVPFGMIFPTSVVQSTNEDGEWGRALRQVLGEYEEDERSFQDANGRQLDLEIIDHNIICNNDCKCMDGCKSVHNINCI